MSTSNHLSASQKGSIAVLVIIVLVLVSLALGVYLVSQKTTLFSDASNPKKSKITEAEPSLKTEVLEVSEDEVVYENPFEEEYENPFNNL